jgi:hypothetical protein
MAAMILGDAKYTKSIFQLSSRDTEVYISVSTEHALYQLKCGLSEFLGTKCAKTIVSDDTDLEYLKRGSVLGVK